MYFYPSEYLTSGISDHLASNRVVLDQNGNPSTTIDYDPWGNVIPMAGPVLSSPTEVTSYTYDGNGSLTGRRKVQVSGSVLQSRDSLTWSYRGLSDRHWTLTVPEPQAE